MYRRIPLSIEVKKVLKLLIYTLLSMLLMASAYFFVKTSMTAERGYMLRENQLRQKALESENRILKRRVLDAQSLFELKKSDVVLDMDEPYSPIYLKPASPLTKKR